MYMAVSASIASLPVPAKVKFGQVTPTKIFPINLPVLSHTCRTHGLVNGIKEDGKGTNVDAISAAGVDIPIRVDLQSVGHTRVNVSKDAPVAERLRAFVDVERISERARRVSGAVACSDRGHTHCGWRSLLDTEYTLSCTCVCSMMCPSGLHRYGLDRGDERTCTRPCRLWRTRYHSAFRCRLQRRARRP